MLRRDPLADPEALIRRVYAYVAYRVGDGPDAEDIASEAFARAVRYRESFDETRGDPVAWLIGIARRCIAAHFHDRPEPAVELPDAPAPGNLADDAVRRLELARALATLDARDRELVALRYGADLTAKQIAELLGLRVNTVEVALHRTLRRLRNVLEGTQGGVEASASPSFAVRV
jgi:RNA polymerase sigma factor (sigma-70 family)